MTRRRQHDGPADARRPSLLASAFAVLMALAAAGTPALLGL